MRPLPWTLRIDRPEDLRPLVQDLLSLRASRTIWLLEGDVGSGKTETVKVLASELGFTEVASPSFAIHHRYENKSESLDHLDLYRLASAEDLESTGFWDLFAEPQGFVVIEWSDRINYEYLPKNWQIFLIRYSKGSTPTERHLQISNLT